jgi:hypothetical protein
MRSASERFGLFFFFFLCPKKSLRLFISNKRIFLVAVGELGALARHRLSCPSSIHHFLFTVPRDALLLLAAAAPFVLLQNPVCLCDAGNKRSQPTAL